MLNTMDDIKALNERIGHHFFDRDTMKFFHSRIESDVIGHDAEGAAIFVTSEQDTPRQKTRSYTIRYACDSGYIGKHGEFQARRAAMAEARALAVKSPHAVPQSHDLTHEPPA